MKRILSVLLIAVIICFSFAGCTKYSSKYTALMMVSSNDSDSASLNFDSFVGTRVFKMKNKSNSDKTLEYSGKIEGGNARVYYDNESEKTELFSLATDEQKNSSVTIKKKSTVYVIIEADSKCSNGEFKFEIK
ncbi:MAG: hypothetical protein K5917_07150 [Clostridiales bacterium]|nr:hypothetical protein [Clostridiales bacterium]